MTIEQLFGTLQQSVVSTWRKHLRTAKYSKHMALNDFYEEMPDKVDALIEAWMGVNNKKIKNYENILQSSNMNTLSYLKELRRVVKQGYVLMNGEKELEALLDDIVELIDSTLYKVKELNENNMIDLKDFINESLSANKIKNNLLNFFNKVIKPFSKTFDLPYIAFGNGNIKINRRDFTIEHNEDINNLLFNCIKYLEFNYGDKITNKKQTSAVKNELIDSQIFEITDCDDREALAIYNDICNKFESEVNKLDDIYGDKKIIVTELQKGVKSCSVELTLTDEHGEFKTYISPSVILATHDSVY